MDWTLALERNHTILLRIVTELFAYLRLEVGESVATMPRYKRLTVLFVLRPAESAYRRVILIAVFVYKITAPEVRERAARSGRAKAKEKAKSKDAKSNCARKSPPPFKLIDPRKVFEFMRNLTPKRIPGPGPWITSFDPGVRQLDRTPLYEWQERQNQPGPAPDDEMSATALCNRLNALMAALQDLPGQALRMVKLEARLKRRFERHGKPNLPPMRPGLPPGFRQRQKHEVDEILAECHRLAMRVVNAPDTS